MTDPSTFSDTDLLAEFHRVEWIAGEPVHEALLAEVRRRELDF